MTSIRSFVHHPTRNREADRMVPRVTYDGVGATVGGGVFVPPERRPTARRTSAETTRSEVARPHRHTELPSTRGLLFMAAYAKMKESEESDDENFPTKAELREAREVCKMAFDCTE